MLQPTPPPLPPPPEALPSPTPILALVDCSVAPIAPAIRHPVGEPVDEYAAFATHSSDHFDGEPELEDEYAAFTELSSDTAPAGDGDDSREDVDSDGSPFGVDSNIHKDSVAADILWMPPGDMARAERVAYAFINEDGPIFNLAPYIHDAIFSVAPTIKFHMLPSSRGYMLLRFDNKGDRDAVASLSPIIYDGAHVSLEHSEETSNWFEVNQSWLVALSAVGFPDEHWNEEGIKAAFWKIGTVVEIDPSCLDVNNKLFPIDLSSVWVVVARSHPTGVPEDLIVGNPRVGARGRALCSAFTVTVLRAWPRVT